MLARIYANMSIVAGIVPLHRLARLYARRSREVAEEVGLDIANLSLLNVYSEPGETVVLVVFSAVPIWFAQRLAGAEQTHR